MQRAFQSREGIVIKQGVSMQEKHSIRQLIPIGINNLINVCRNVYWECKEMVWRIEYKCVSAFLFDEKWHIVFSLHNYK